MSELYRSDRREPAGRFVDDTHKRPCEEHKDLFALGSLTSNDSSKRKKEECVDVYSDLGFSGSFGAGLCSTISIRWVFVSVRNANTTIQKVGIGLPIVGHELCDSDGICPFVAEFL